MTPVPDIVQVSKLDDTKFHSNPKYTQHVKYLSRSHTKQRSIRIEERWKEEGALGTGGFGIVWLERCIQGESEGQLRAVKKVKKLEAGDYYKELEAIALFSHTKYERCFVKSFGWYDDTHSIFITMEYLSNGDLHKYLGSPLPEREGQQIVFQILEGLQFMHDSGFAHRDLKPANILVVCKGPDWWIKLADFGISKRAREGTTELRTLTGTPAFAAPEVLGFFPHGDVMTNSYTNAVDIWSLGVITFLILTGKSLFQDQRRLGQYVGGSFTFPSDVLLANRVSAQACDFIKSLMAPKSDDRPGVKECINHPWLHRLIESPGTQRAVPISSSSSSSLDYSDPEFSAVWSTQNQNPVEKTHISTRVLSQKGTYTSEETITESSLEPATPVYWNKLKTLKGHLDEVYSVAFSPDGKQIASGSEDRSIRLWSLDTGEVRILKGHSNWVASVAFSPDGKEIASASGDKTVRLWDSATGTERHILKGHSDAVYSAVFSPDGKQIVSASGDKTIRLWDSATGTERHILKGHLGWVGSVAFSPDGKQIASASADKTVRLWDSATGTERGVLKGHSEWVISVAFSPDGKQIASASYDKTVRLWDSATGTERHILKGHSDAVYSAVFSPDGKQIASASEDKTVRLWDSATRTERGVLKGHSKFVSSVAFSPDGKYIASASYDNTVRLWVSGPYPGEESSSPFIEKFKNLLDRRSLQPRFHPF